MAAATSQPAATGLPTSPPTWSPSWTRWTSNAPCWSATRWAASTRCAAPSTIRRASPACWWPARCPGSADRRICLLFHREQIVPLPDPVPEAFARAFQQSTLAQPIPAAILEVSSPTAEGARPRLARSFRGLHRRRLLVAPARDQRAGPDHRAPTMRSAGPRPAGHARFYPAGPIRRVRRRRPRHALGRAAALRPRPPPLRLLGRRRHGAA